MRGDQKRLNHPLISYVFGVFIIVFILFVVIGIIHHLTISPYGPGLLVPIKEKYEEERESIILAEVRRQEELEKHKHFHIEADYLQLPEEKRSVCYICHSDFPHSRNKKVRSMMNMHTQFLKCETCHLKEKPALELVYKWYDPFDENPEGPFFGTNYDPETGKLLVGNKYAKIAPYFKQNLMDYSSEDKVTTDHLELAIKMQDAPLAIDFMKVRDKLTPEQRDGVKNKFHENTKPKGHECKTCHSDKSIFNFEGLGFSEKRISNLTTTEIVGIITKYDDFYLPQFFED